MKFPKKKDIEEVLQNLKDDDFTKLLKDDASQVDITKFELCRKFVIYLKDQQLTQSALATRLGVNRSRVNWIVKYRIEHFTIDRLYELWAIIEPDFKLKVS